MSASSSRVLAAVWFGAALASLFFYPLLQVLNGDVYFLHWQPANTAEFAVAFTALTVLCAAAWFRIALVASERWQLTLLVLLIAVPVGSFAATITRLLPIKETLIPVMVRREVLGGLAAGGALIALVITAYMPGRMIRLARGIVLVLSPVTLLVCATTVRHLGPASHPMSAPQPARVPPPLSVRSEATPSVFVFVFDELSFRFVYEHGDVSARLPNLRAFAGGSTHYMAAEAPGDETITSVPGLLAGRRYDDVDAGGDELYEVRRDGTHIPIDLQRPDGLFARARARGLRTEVAGYYLPFCRLLSGMADQCRSFSFYNYATVADGFSPVNQVLTNLILLPYQQPFRPLKMPAFSRLQRRIVEETMAAAVSGLAPSEPRFRFIHFSVPHLPFVFHREGYGTVGDPMLKDAPNYQFNLEYVDTLVGQLVDALRKAHAFDASVVVVTSDHEYRWPKMNPGEGAHVPLMIKRAGQRVRETVTDPVRAERILAGLFEPAR